MSCCCSESFASESQIPRPRETRDGRSVYGHPGHFPFRDFSAISVYPYLARLQQITKFG